MAVTFFYNTFTSLFSTKYYCDCDTTMNAKYS